MRIKKIEIQKYKSIGNKCKLIFNDRITVLVGKSNVGKSNLLEALSLAFDDNEIPQNAKCTWERVNSNEEFVSVYFDLSEKDKKELVKIWTGFKNVKELIVKKKFNGERDLEFIPDIESQKISIPDEYTAEQLKNDRRKIRKQLRAWSSVITSQVEIFKDDEASLLFNEIDKLVNEEKLLHPRENIEQQKDSFNILLERLKKNRTILNKSKYESLNVKGIKRGLTYLIKDIEDQFDNIKFIQKKKNEFLDSQIFDLLPKVTYVTSNTKIEVSDEVDLKDIEVGKANIFANKIIELSEFDLNIIKMGDSRRIATAEENANEILIKKLAKFWSQEKLKIELRYWPAGNNQILKFAFIGDENHKGSIDDQSPGFKWFFGFIVKYLLDSETNNRLLLLDEPALNLHAQAQIDLLERFENTNPNFQIIYTTHSPFLINKNFPSRIISVEKNKNDIRGTSFNLKPYHSQKGRAWEPIRSSIGLPIGASLFVAGRNIVVEGITDQVIISGIIQVLKKKDGNLRFDLNRVSINYPGYIENLAPLVIFCYQEGIDVKVILDSDRGKEYSDKITKGGVPKEQIFIINEVLEKKYIDIENLFEEKFYHSCFLEVYHGMRDFAYKDKLPETFEQIKELFKNEEEKTKNWGRSKFYKEYFNKYSNGKLGGFNKYRVSIHIIEKLLNTDNEIKNIGLKNFEKLLNKVWDSKPEW